MAEMYYKNHWYGADKREELLDLIRSGESNVRGNIWECGFAPNYTVAEAKEAYAMGLYHDRENGRTANKELSVYDAMMAEILCERNAEKRKHEKHRDAEQYRKAQSQKYRNRSGKKREELPKCYLRGHDWDAGYYRNWKAYCEFKSRVEWKQNIAEKVIRADWELEQIDIADCAMWRDINAEIEAERLRNLNEWLKYA